VDQDKDRERPSPPRRMAKVPFPPAKYGLWLAIVIIGAVLLLMVTGVIAAQVD